MDIPDTEHFFSENAMGDVLAPMDRVRRTYWYGIFAGQPSTSRLFCPAFYLGTHEKNTYGKLAYITRAGRFMRENGLCFIWSFIFLRSSWMTF